MIEGERTLENLKKELVAMRDFNFDKFLGLFTDNTKHPHRGTREFITRSEFQNTLQNQIKVEMTESEFSALFKSIDKDNDDALSIVEMMDLVTPAARKACRMNAYDEAELSKETMWTLAKLVRMAVANEAELELLREEMVKDELSKKRVRAIFADMDQNDDGEVDISELAEYVLVNMKTYATEADLISLMAKLDRKRCGFFTYADFLLTVLPKTV
jgi:Ca2+-binding EF-hand superfamily protein